MSGPFQTPGAPLSTMGVFRTSEAAEEFAAGDPYMLNGLAQGWEIRLWHAAKWRLREWTDIVAQAVVATKPSA